MIFTKAFCDSQPKAMVTVTNPDGRTVSAEVMDGPASMFVGMILAAAQNPIKKAALDKHIGFTRFCGDVDAIIFARIKGSVST